MATSPVAVSSAVQKLASTGGETEKALLLCTLNRGCVLSLHHSPLRAGPCTAAVGGGWLVVPGSGFAAGETTASPVYKTA